MFSHCYRVTSSESLLNPINWEAYSYTEEYYRCDCPSVSENITAPGYQSYLGAMMCSDLVPCTVEHEGRVQNASTRPDFGLGDVTISPMIENNVLYLDCKFIRKEEFVYDVAWYV